MNAEFLPALLYFSLWLVKELRLSATPALLYSDRRCADSRAPHDVTNFKFNHCSLFICGGNRTTLRKPP